MTWLHSLMKKKNLGEIIGAFLMKKKNLGETIGGKIKYCKIFIIIDKKFDISHSSRAADPTATEAVANGRQRHACKNCLLLCLRQWAIGAKIASHCLHKMKRLKMGGNCILVILFFVEG